MKQSSALLVFVVIMLLKILYTEAHFKPRHMDQSLSSPLGFQQTSALFGQSDLKTSLAIQKTIAFITILTSHPKLLCVVPPFLIVDFLTQLTCNPAVLNAIPHNMLTGFMTSLSGVPTLANAIPPSLFLSISNTLSIGTPDATATGPAESPRPEFPQTSLPGTFVSAEVAAVVTPSTPSSGSAPSVPGISVTKNVTASISPASSSLGPASNVPGISVTKDVTTSILPAAPSSGPTSNLPGVSITKDVAASISPIPPPPAAPVIPADLPTSDGIPPAVPIAPVVPLAPAVPLAPTVPLVPEVPLSPAPSVPCVEVPVIGSPPTLPDLTPMPTLSLSPLSILSSLFSKGTGNSLLEAKIEAILKLFANGNFKLPQLRLPEVVSTVSKKPIVPVKQQQVFILLPAPLQGKPEIPSSQATKVYYKPESLNQIIDFFHQRLFTPPKKLTLPKLDLQKLSLPKLNLPKITPQYPVPVQTSPIKCIPIFSKVPC